MNTFQTTDWQNLPATQHVGETGFVLMKTVWLDHIKIRQIKYSANYKADHWCSKGHIIYCLNGEYELHLKDGSIHKFSQGMGYQTFDNAENPHMAVSKNGCLLFVVDGDFLKS